MDITQKIHEVKSSVKTKEILLKWMKEGISASSIQKYCTCPLDFYFKYVLKIYGSILKKVTRNKCF